MCPLVAYVKWCESFAGSRENNRLGLRKIYFWPWHTQDWWSESPIRGKCQENIQKGVEEEHSIFIQSRILLSHRVQRRSVSVDITILDQLYAG
jgi:hypothetical protein